MEFDRDNDSPVPFLGYTTFLVARLFGCKIEKKPVATLSLVIRLCATLSRVAPLVTNVFHKYRSLIS